MIIILQPQRGFLLDVRQILDSVRPFGVADKRHRSTRMTAGSGRKQAPAFVKARRLGTVLIRKYVERDRKATSPPREAEFDLEA
ncbi:MAG: hypothetical protein A3E79_10950 [Burkholderiales bacterium RIFCSPHIGHO2_12_FULL_61_11]|nr:MAG: hypothetical protein A3E79_10950 [Burkholderiales bacterium RIFCSPHIGHO2_12_FULL_61_11]